MQLSRRSVLLGTLGIGLAGCGESRTAANLMGAIRFATLGLPDVELDRASISKLPYASISAKIGQGPRSLLILWRRERDDLHWLSADGAAFVTRHGRVVKTAGLPDNIGETIALTDDPLAVGLNLPDTPTLHLRKIDLATQLLYGLNVTSRFDFVGEETLTIVDREFNTLRFTEHNQVSSLNWNFENTFWVDPHDGKIWKSIQHLSRTFPPIQIEMLKPAA
jgi:hypothetical protein